MQDSQLQVAGAPAATVLFRWLAPDLVSDASPKLLQTDGKVVFTESAPFEASMAILSAGGQRFVVPFFQPNGGVAALDIGAHGELKTISVYDAPFHERSYKLGMIGPTIKDQGTQLALSPDVSRHGGESRSQSGAPSKLQHTKALESKDNLPSFRCS